MAQAQFTIVSPQPSAAPAANAFTVDVEDYFHVQAFAGRFAPEDWPALESRVVPNTERLLDLMAEAQVKGTFFVLGWVGERHPALVRRIVAEGHELASHGYWHKRALEQTADEFREDVRRAKAVLEDAGGVAVSGYRAPTFSINHGNLWAYDVLAETGHGYSSSIYPVRHDLYGFPAAPRVPFRPLTDHHLVEFPMPTLSLGARTLPGGGGGYFRLLPYALSEAMVARVIRAGQPFNFYCHPWEIDPDQPRVSGIGWKSRLRHYTNLHAMAPRLRRLLKAYAWGPMRTAFSAYGAAS